VIGLLGHVFGTRSLGELIGVTVAIPQLCGAMGPYMAGYLFDRWHTYSIIFVLLGVLVGLSSLLALRLRTELSAHRSDAAA
jgi:cyanate permease